MRYKFTDKELKTIQESIVVVVDTREKANKHIIEYFDKIGIEYVCKKNDYGDYSCYIPANPSLGILRDIYLDRDICIERKAGIDELCGNLKEDASRLKSEFAHINKYDIKCILMVEDALFDKHIREGKYRSAYEPKTLYARLKGLEAEYNFVIRPVHKDFIASEIYHTLKYFTRDYFKNWANTIERISK
jgi:ERCC4-type nuclease